MHFPYLKLKYYSGITSVTIEILKYMEVILPSSTVTSLLGQFKVGPIQAKSTNLAHRQVIDFIKIWTVGKKGREKLICQGNFICDELFPRFRALKNYFSHFAVRNFFAHVFFLFLLISKCYDELLSF